MNKVKEGYAQAVDGTKIHYEYIPAPGKGPTLAFCNGVLCTNSYFVYIMRHFEGRYPILTWDYRGHGQSEVPADYNSLTISNHALDLEAVMNASGVKEAVFLGFSVGVEVAFEFYRNRPSRTMSIISISGGVEKPFNLFFGTDKLEDVTGAFLNFGAKIGSVLNPVLKVFLRSPLVMPTAWVIGADRNRVIKNDMVPHFEHMIKMDKKLAFTALRLMNEHSAMDVLQKVKIPVLIIMGTHDRMTPPRHAYTMHKKIAGSELFIVPHGRHAALIENPLAINFRIEIFLRDHFGYSAPLSSMKKRKGSVKRKR